MEFKHKEAFCLMVYMCEKCGKKETLWNSRDGVTPFILRCSKCEGRAQHVDFGDDEYAPNHFPESGQRIFVDLTENRHLIHLRARVQMFWEVDYFDCHEKYTTREKMLEALSESGMTKGEPDIMVIHDSEKDKDMTGSEALFGFCAWLTSREEVTTLSSKHDSAPICELIKEFSEVNELDEPRNDWTDYLKHPEKPKTE